MQTIARANRVFERVECVAGSGLAEKAQACAGARLAIEDGLDEGLPRAYTKETYQQSAMPCCSTVLYMGDGKSSYTDAA